MSSISFGLLASVCVLASAGCTNGPAPYGAHLEGGVCVGDLHGCPLSFDQVPCGTPLGQVGLCNDDRLLYTFAEDRPGMVGDYPLWMCFYDHATGQLIGQRACLDDARVCGDWYCVDTPGTPNCDDYITTLATPACADAGTTD